VSDARLDSDEDAELRRLHMLKAFGMVAGSVVSRYDALRGRDRRRSVRDPEDTTVAAQVSAAQRTGPSRTSRTAVSTTAERTGSIPAESAPERVISDTREVIGEPPQSRRGFGVFRR
jgi:hypothetical protein